MRALKNILVTKHEFVAANLAWVGVNAPAAAVDSDIAARVKDVALFLAAPFVGLAYIVAFPVVGIALLAWLAAKALLANNTTRPLALAVAAPFATLALVTLGPIVGLGALVWIGARSTLRG